MTLVAIAIVVILYSKFVVWFMGISYEAETPTPDYPKILREQAAKAEARRRHTVSGIDLNDWLSLAAHHLMKLWPDMTYDRAMTELRCYLSDIIAEWPSPAMDWSTDAAREAAEEYAREYGEQHGANA